MISPLSVNYALAMTTNGAKENTLNQMLTTLGYGNYSMTEFNRYFKYLMSELVELDPQVNMSIANSIWYRNNFNVLPEFLTVNQDYYDAQISALDFNSPQAVTTINDWVSNATNGKITTIVDAIGPEVVMYLINAIYFYGEWKYEFDETQTADASFYLANGETIQVPTMKMQAGLKYFSTTNASVVEIPYGQGNFVMDVILPGDGQTAAELISTLSSSTWNEWTNGFYATEVVLSMPKFKFDYENSLNEVLIALGMSDLFDSNLADLSGINGDGGLYVSKVKHKTYIDVNEAGTEAAAVTSVEVGVTSVSPDPQIVYVNLDRPFVFIIREVSSESILFSGVVANPLTE
jgi:serpin B